MLLKFEVGPLNVFMLEKDAILLYSLTDVTANSQQSSTSRLTSQRLKTYCKAMQNAINAINANLRLVGSDSP
jgi:hypothetical protein